MDVNSVESCAVTPSRHVNSGCTVLSAVPYPHSVAFFTPQQVQVPAVSRWHRRQGEPHPDCMTSTGIARAYGRLGLHLRVRGRDGQ